LVFTNDFSAIFILAILFAFFVLFKKGESIQQFVFYKQNPSAMHLVWFSIGSIILYFLSLSVLSGSFFNPFVYFRF
jgi:hypothetical protein